MKSFGQCMYDPYYIYILRVISTLLGPILRIMLPFPPYYKMSEEFDFHTLFISVQHFEYPE